MRSRNKRMLRALCAALAAVLLLACAPLQALAESYSAKVTSKHMPVYVNVGGKTKKASIQRDAVVTVGQVRNGVALIRYKGYYCMAPAKNLEKIESDAPESAPSGVKGERAVAKVATLAFSKPSTSSASVKVAAGTQVNVLKVKRNIAQVERGGKIAYMYRPHLMLESEYQQEEEAPAQKQPSSSVEDAFTSGKYSNEQLCYLFLVKVMGYNTAAAAGVLANISYESGFKTGLYGDSGSSYGICQWHASRKTRLTNYCKEHGMKADTLVGQLAYLKYELETYYPKVHRYLKSVSNTAEGAYDAAYYFCYNFEGPAARTSQSTKRGSSAQNTYFPRYASI